MNTSARTCKLHCPMAAGQLRLVSGTSRKRFAHADRGKMTLLHLVPTIIWLMHLAIWRGVRSGRRAAKAIDTYEAGKSRQIYFAVCNRGRNIFCKSEPIVFVGTIGRPGRLKAGPVRCDPKCAQLAANDVDPRIVMQWQCSP